MRRIINAAFAIGLVAAGSAVTAWLIRTKPAPPTRSTFGRETQVAIAAVRPGPERAPVIGYGTVRPKNQVKIIPQVSGKLVYSHDDLAVGKVIPAGELLFEIDSTVYDARVRQVEAEIRGLEATLSRHNQEMTNLDDRMRNAQEMLAIAEADYVTSRRLYEQEQVGTQRDVDLVHQKYLQQKDVIVDISSRRALIPHLKLETQARLDATRSRLEQARHDLESTKIRCPFKARVEAVAAHAAQVVTAHLSIATLTDMEAFEISVGIDPRELRWLDDAIQPASLENKQQAVSPDVKVTWSLPGQEFTWRGRVTRFERVDEATRTARLALEIRDVDMIAEVTLGSSDSAATLSIGMHCRAELPAATLLDALVIPRHAIYDHRWVYIFEPDEPSAACNTGRLARRRVPLLRGLGDNVLVDYRDRDGGEPCELRPGELLVVSPLVKPIVGMRVALQGERVAGAAGEPPAPASAAAPLAPLKSAPTTVLAQITPVARSH